MTEESKEVCEVSRKHGFGRGAVRVAPEALKGRK